ncbi:MAG: hypothetical protein ACTSPD_21905, partial [Promethearchaeota archaeon]
MPLDYLEIANGVLILILNFISLSVGIKIFSKYFTLKQRAFFFVGLAWIFISCPWYPGGISFIMLLISGKYLDAKVYMIIGNIFIPIALICWIIAFTDLLNKSKQKLIILAFIVYGIIFYAIFFYLLSKDPLLIGEVKGIDVKYNIFIVIYSLSVLLIVIITGILFTRESLKSENPEIRLKGKFLLLAFILFVIGASLDALLTLNIITLILFRVLEISSAIAFYFGFILPEKVKNFLIKS